MRVDIVISTIWSVILLLHLVNAKANITRTKHKSTSKEIPEPARKLNIVPPFIEESDDNELEGFNENEQFEKSPMKLNNMTDILNGLAKNMTAAMTKWQYGIVSYRIDENTFDNFLKIRLKKAMDIIETASCVRFKETSEPTEGESWLHFTNPDRTRECSHEATEGEKGDIIIILGFECLKTRDVLHTILHGLGFKDEVTHPHRDQYIRILWDNIQTKYRNLFSIRHEEGNKLVEYDPRSIMHFHNRAYSSNGGLTIASVINGLVINPSDKLSQIDVMKLRLTFGHECNKRKVGDIVENCKNIFYKKNTEKEENEKIDDSEQDEDKDSEDDSIHKQDNDGEKKQENIDIEDSSDHDVPVKPKKPKNPKTIKDKNIKVIKSTPRPTKPEEDDVVIADDEYYDEEEEEEKDQQSNDGVEDNEHGDELVPSEEGDSKAQEVSGDVIFYDPDPENHVKEEDKQTQEVSHDDTLYYDPVFARRFPLHLRFKNIH